MFLMLVVLIYVQILSISVLETFQTTAKNFQPRNWFGKFGKFGTSEGLIYITLITNYFKGVTMPLIARQLKHLKRGQVKKIMAVS